MQRPPGDGQLRAVVDSAYMLTDDETGEVFFHGMLVEGGYLLLGHSETLWQVTDAFSLVPVGDAFVYRRSPERAGHHDRSGGSRSSRPVVMPGLRLSFRSRSSRTERSPRPCTYGISGAQRP